jgi:hypothetical protein
VGANQFSGRGGLANASFAAMMPRLSLVDLRFWRMSADYTLPPPRRPRPAASTLSGGDGGGTLDPMEARVARLEDDMREIKTDLKALRLDMRTGFDGLGRDIRNMAVEIAEIKGRIAHLPTVWQINLQMIGLIFTVMGGAFLIVRYGIH